MRPAQRHRFGYRLGRYFKLSHHDVALMDDRFAVAYMFRRHQQICAQINCDPVFAIRQNVDESNACICSWQSVDMVDRYALFSIELQGAVAKDIVADASQQAHLGAQTRRRDRLIAALAAGTHVERVADQAFAQRGHTWHSDREPLYITANYEYLGHVAILNLLKISRSVWAG